jgi:large subunit ribosomal protein L31e
MAEKKTTEKLERTYIIPVRKDTIKVERWRRAKRAMSFIRAFMKRHMKCDNVKMGQELNELVWARGGKYVPNKVEIYAVKEDDVVRMNLKGAPLPKVEEREEKKTEEKKEEKKEDKKEIERKEELKAEKKAFKTEHKPDFKAEYTHEAKS